MTQSIRKHLPQLGLCALVAVLLGCTGYWMLFTTFMPHDDEGYVLWSVRQFCEGHALYTEVFSQYGPMFYAWYRLWHGATGLLFDSESARWVTLVYWLVASGACGYMAWRLTRRWLPAVAAGMLSFAALQEMIREPFHPGGFLAAITAAGTAVCLVALLREANRAFAITGAFVGAAMALMKINVGIFFLIAVGSWVALHSGGRKWSWAALMLTALGVVATPVALMKTHLHESWVHDFVLVFAASALAVLFHLRRVERGTGFNSQDWISMIITASLVTASMVVFCAATGTPVTRFWEGIVITPLRQPDVSTFAIHWRPGAVAVAILALVMALVQLASTKRPAVIAGLRLLGGLAVLAQLTGLIFEKPFYAVFEFAPALAWLMATPLTDVREADPAARGRSWLAWCAIWEILQAYPVGGSQMAWGSFLFIPLLVVGSYDAICHLLQNTRRPQLAMPVTGGLLFGLGAIAIWQLGSDALIAYLDHEPLGLPGAESLRLPGTLTGELRTISRNVAVHGGMLFSAPGMFSFNIWTQKPTPTAANTTVWRKLLNEEQKAEIATRLHQDKTSMVIARFTNGMFYSGDNFLSTFKLALFVGDYALWTNKDATILPLGIVRIEKSADGRAFFVIVVDPTQHRISGLQIRDHERHEMAWKTGIPPGNGWRITPVNLQGRITGESRSETLPFVLPDYSLVQVEISPAMTRIDLKKAEVALVDTDGAVVESFCFDKLADASEFIPR